MKCVIGNKKTDFLSKKMFGLFFEDINYAADGGLYAEMLENRQFAFRKATPGIIEKTYDTEWVPGYGWTVAKGDGELTYPEQGGLSENNPHYMVFSVKSDKAAFSNKAYDGICLKKGAQYRVAVWAKADMQQKLTVKIIDGEDICAQGTVIVDAGVAWNCCEVILTAERKLRNGQFLVEQEQGSVSYGMLSMMPCDAVAGVFRKDLFEMLADMKPGFLRFPGGCIVEGANLSNRYRWKDTVGENIDRKWNWSRWAVHDFTMGQGEPLFFPFYNQSYGIGFYEYFLLCDLLGCKPLPVLNVGLACQFQSDELVPVDSEAFQEYLQDALDLIEFANGDSSTTYGALRAKMGHPEPFGLEYVGIGNEQWETDKVDFYARYMAFEKAIHTVHPEIELLGSAGPDVTSERYTSAWAYYKENCAKNAAFTAAVDEHYYMPPAWFYEHLAMYDTYSRDIPVFAGEFAAHCEGKRNTLEAALAEASFMCGLERNGDVIRFASAAPLFSRKGYEQWIPDYIWFDGENVMGTPGYQVQKLFSLYTGDRAMEHKLTEASEKIVSAVSADDQHTYIKLINNGDSAVSLDELVMGDKAMALDSAIVYQMSGNDLQEENTLGEPEKMILTEQAAAENIMLPAYSCTVVIL